MLDEDALVAAMAGCALPTTSRASTRCARPIPAALFHVNVRGAETAVRAAARAGVERVSSPPRPPRSARRRGTVGSEDLAAPRQLPVGLRALQARGRARRVRRRPRARASTLVAVNPSSVQGPGRAGGTGRILIAYLNGRLRAFVDTTISLVDIDDCAEAHVLAAERGAAGERYVI